MKTNPIAVCDSPMNWFRGVLTGEWTADDGVRHFVETMFGVIDLQGLIAGNHSTETESLLELIFFPDADLQAVYEARWGDIAFSEAQRGRFIAGLAAEKIVARVKMSVDGDAAPVTIPARVKAAFVERLNITWRPPPRLLDVLKKHIPEAALPAIRVRLRNTPMVWRHARLNLMCRFIESFSVADQDHGACFTLLLSLLGEMEANQPAYDFLMARKQARFQALCSTVQAFQHRRRAGNMEILMSRGFRAAHGDIGELQVSLNLIDRLSLALFGRTEFFQAPAEHVQQFDMGAEDRDMERIAALLW